MSELRIVSDPQAPESLRQFVRDRLDLYNVAVTGRSDWYPVAMFLKDASDAIWGGLLGDIWAEWLHVTFLWVDDCRRGRGFGRQLLLAGERYAVERGCHDAHLSTFSFQAPAFYRRLGYEVFGTLDGHPPGHMHYFLRKRLTGAAGAV